eukprot:CAMPEP_0203760360 /NCGR_PEP_ID=MMETSP0098-20131031/13672_1 /ASSEMBLY_ACC=CAM_ASM_000208 /TAXON_ID=96639 /ORGANISM=" , Strain NY0313808BC1" /LENGTH=171 /DNA_ID=CAMNT_0050653885 /DNA_START=57 /DNA_END=569 /DNA_ORIENTATION=+
MDTSKQLSSNFSDHLKKVGNDPIIGLCSVQRHIREKGIRDQVVIKNALLQRMFEMRQVASTARSNRFRQEKGQTEEEQELGLQGQGQGSVDLNKVTGVLDALADRVEALRQTIEIVSGIQEAVQTPGKKGRKHIARDRGGSDVETMPVGIGQLLDQTLMSGEMDVDQYAMQ